MLRRYIESVAGANTMSAPCPPAASRSASSVRGYLPKSSPGPNCVGLTNIVTTVKSHSRLRRVDQAQVPCVQAPIVGTRPIGLDRHAVPWPLRDAIRRRWRLTEFGRGIGCRHANLPSWSRTSLAHDRSPTHCIDRIAADISSICDCRSEPANKTGPNLAPGQTKQLSWQPLHWR